VQLSAGTVAGLAESASLLGIAMPSVVP